MKTKVLEEDLELLILRYGEQCSFGDKDTRRKAREVIVDYVKKSLTKHTEEVIKDLLGNLTWYHNDIGVKELEDNVDYIKVSDINQEAKERYKITI